MTANLDSVRPDDSPELAEKVGRLLLVGFEGRDFPEVEDLVTRVRPAGLIFFKRNYPEAGGPRALRTLIAQAQDLARSVLGRSLFIAVDHEGGRVQRLSAPYTHLPPPGELGTAEAAEKAAWQGARELAATGFNFNLAPVLDLASPDGVAIGDRSFGAEPEQVVALGRATLAAYHRAGLLGAGKHFPGLGEATLDPHQALPVVPVDVARLAERELAPFLALIGEGLSAVMTTHALYPALDAGRPATFSEEIVGRLKDEMGFGGAVLTDDLEMGAVVKNYPLGEAAVAAVRAGHDLALICRQRDYVEECRRALAAALRSGALAEARVDDALARTDLLFRRLDEFRTPQTLRDEWFAELAAREAH